ncbi:MAG: M28 family peptidase [Acidobacteriota bacterium]
MRPVPILILLLGGPAFAQPALWSSLQIDPERILAHVRALASDDLEGRGNGTPGLRRAADYIASEFGKARLEAGGDGGTYRQAFEITASIDGAPGPLTFTTPSGDTAFRVGVHYHPLAAPDARSAASPHPTAPVRIGVVFAGYGIVAPELGYDDYVGLDVSGRAVVVFTHEPQERDEHSPFDGRELTPHATIDRKAEQAAVRRARLLILVEDPLHAADRALAPSWADDPQIGHYALPVVRIDRLRLDRVLEDVDFEQAARGIDRRLQPQSRELGGVLVGFAEPILAVNPQAANLVGVLRGSDPSLAAEAVVIGAHYDHLGFGGGQARDRRTAGQIHNGADDNASGTSALIEMAHAAGRLRVRPRRSVVFAAFAGEELGFLGSRHYVTRAPISVRHTIAMVNLDMIGRANGRVMVGGIDREPTLGRLVHELGRLSTLKLDDFRRGYAPGQSDSESFARLQVPTLLLFTGFHDDYHQPTDDWDRIDARGVAEIARLALAVTVRLASDP